jgi:hypothetical protein
LNVLENPTGSTDSYGNPPHSLTVVVEGGDPNAIALAIYNNKGIGPTVNGTNPIAVPAVVVSDPNNGYFSQTMYFFRPTYDEIIVSVFVLPLTGYTTATTAAIQSAVQAYINSLQIGQALLYSEVYAAIVNVQANPSVPQFSVKAMYMTGYNTSNTSPANVTINSGGTGYLSTDAVLITGGGDNAQLNITSVGAGGVVTGLNPALSLGTGYAVGTNIATSGGTGTGLTVNIVTTGPASPYVSDIPNNFYGAVQMTSATQYVNVVVLNPGFT